VFATASDRPRDKNSVRESGLAPVVDRANAGAEGVSRKNVHAAFDELVNGADRDKLRSPF
jgi:hypothetical protein